MLSERQRVSRRSLRKRLRDARLPAGTPPRNARTAHACGAGLLPRTVRLQDPPHDAPPTLRRYARWHATARACLADRQCARKPRVLVWRCLPAGQCAGMGDRFRGINLVFLLAVLTRRVFLLDLPQGRYNIFPLTAAVLPCAIDWTLPPAFDYASGGAPLNWHNPSSFASVPAPDGRPINLFRDDAVARLADFPVVSIKTNAALNVLRKVLAAENRRGRLLDLAPHAIDSGMLMRVFAHMLYRPTAAVQALARNALPDGFVAGGYIGVHVRTGEDVEEGGLGRFQAMRRNYTRVASQLLDCTKEVDSSGTRRVYLASDSQSVKREFGRLARRQGFRIATLSGRAMHVSAKVGNLSDDGRRQLCVNYLNVFVDLFNLANGLSVVTTGSGFARAAYTIGEPEQLRISYSRTGVRCASSKLRR